MQLATYSHKGRVTYGLVVGDGLVDISARVPQFPSLLDALRANALDSIRSLVAGAEADVALDEVELLPPVANGEKILCVGVNYVDRNAEYRDDTPVPTYPSLFMRTPGSFTGHGTPLIRPRVSNQLDYEGEIALVIGRRGRHVPAERGQELIAGLTIANEGTVRDWVRHGKFNVTQGKNFDRSGALGPWMVSAVDLDLDQPRTLVTWVNGEVRQQANTAQMIFSFGYLLAYITTFTTLKPGDLILTGTPTGAGGRFDPPRWLAPGDVVEIEVEGIGTLRNGVMDEASV